LAACRRLKTLCLELLPAVVDLTGNPRSDRDDGEQRQRTQRGHPPTWGEPRGPLQMSHRQAHRHL
jgi:hypothetical protein